MANYPNIYKGAPYKFQYGNGGVEDPYLPGSESLSPNNSTLYRTRAANVGLATDVRTADQLHEVSNKLSTGAKTIEVSAIQPNLLEAIPKQHFEELARLKKLVGADLTFHGPLIEPSGVTQNGWDEAARQQAERQLSEAVLRSHQLNPDGNTVVTLHSSNGLLAPTIRMKNLEPGAKEPDNVVNMAVIDPRANRMGYLPKPKADKFLGKEEGAPMDALNELNQEAWKSELNTLSVEAMRGRDEVRDGLGKLRNIGENDSEQISQLYKYYRENKMQDYEKMLNTIGKSSEISRELVQNRIESLNHGEIKVNDAYRRLREMYNKAYEAAEQSRDEEKKKQLDAYREQAAKKIQEYQKDPLKIGEFAHEVAQGVAIISNLYSDAGKDNAPQSFKPLRDFAIEKASETFGNVAYNAYKQFGKNAPIISIENPPVGMGLSRGDELRDLVKATQEHFKRRVLDDKKLRLSDKEADEQAKKLIGVTWDVGHINMIRKYGYDDNDLIEETKKVKDYVKHIHLSDNFGLEHTELPMGMGNVPLKEHLKELGDKAAKAKQIVETGDWYQHFKSSPFSETLHALGSPIYAMHMEPYWNQRGASGIPYSGQPGYFAGYGLVPDVNYSTYGMGFSSLPLELGGQQGGRSRLGGTPLE